VDGQTIPSRRKPRLLARAKISSHVRAPASAVRQLVADYERWPALFPMIAAARLVDDSHGVSVIAVRHRKFGEVVNRLADGPNGSLILEEAKPAYDAQFINEFVPVATGGTRVTITAEIRLKGWRHLVSPFVGPIIRRQLKHLTLDPLRRAAERDVRLASASAVGA
jgi:hypothetical protein